MRGQLYDADYKPRLSGHETFPLRYGWLKKAYDAVGDARGADGSRSVFADDGAIAQFGVGKNMVRSMRHWAMAAGVVSGDGRATTEFGRYLFADDGLDPYMEDPATAWLVHWRIAGNAAYTTWFWGFSHCPVGTFDRDTLVQGLVKFARDRGWARAAVSTIRNDVLCFVRTYVPRTPSRRASYEDALESPLTELGLIGQMGRRDGFRFARGRKPTLGPGVVAYAITTFWNAYSTSQTLSFEALAHEPGSPGRVFLLDENTLADRLFGIEAASGGAYGWSETAGLKQLIREREVTDDEALAFVGGGLRFVTGAQHGLMSLADRVHVARRYRRAIRLEADLGNASALEGFICSRTASEVLESMARHVLETEQCAFTWTGPYGGGKSSLAVALGSLLGESQRLRQEAARVLGERTAALLREALPPRSRGWRILPVTGRRDRPAQVIGEAIEAAGWLPAGETVTPWSEKRVLDALAAIAARNPRAGGGLVVFIDEMGKFLEAAARDGTDIYLFQELAEVASRSGGRLLVVGILHQAFGEYAHHLSRAMRDEWAKLQGRFVDLAMSAAGGEQIDLLRRAIRSEAGCTVPRYLAEGVAQLVQGHSPELGAVLEDCWPLHPAARVPARTPFAPAIRPEPAKSLRFPQFG